MPEATDPIGELADLALHVMDDRCSAVTMALPDDPASVLRPMVEAVLAEASAQAWIEKQLAETGLKSMDFRNGMTMEVEPARDMVAQWVGAARAMLGDAPNYTETPVEMVVKVAENPERFAFTLQRVGKITPHQARQQAETALAEVLRIVSDYVIESNDSGGIDCNDLAWRLQEVGHPLPTPAP
ncbi:hypothetical protein [Streptomyces lunaelactis]|uniref:hypothetical protein n=1 Tax=Streptomyces lunaelactis TaxID=1535768 RepID=UPI0015847686|nr:hypothetical protein [Streptomyces lunaelactis]NUL14478.1 hypothetical protein [Streptomyces lunaelactis]